MNIKNKINIITNNLTSEYSYTLDQVIDFIIDKENLPCEYKFIGNAGDEYTGEIAENDVTGKIAIYFIEDTDSGQEGLRSVVVFPADEDSSDFQYYEFANDPDTFTLTYETHTLAPKPDFKAEKKKLKKYLEKFFISKSYKLQPITY